MGTAYLTIPNEIDFDLAAMFGMIQSCVSVPGYQKPTEYKNMYAAMQRAASQHKYKNKPLVGTTATSRITTLRFVFRGGFSFGTNLILKINYLFLYKSIDFLKGKWYNKDSQ